VCSCEKGGIAHRAKKKRESRAAVRKGKGNCFLHTSFGKRGEGQAISKDSARTLKGESKEKKDHDISPSRMQRKGKKREDVEVSHLKGRFEKKKREDRQPPNPVRWRPEGGEVSEGVGSQALRRKGAMFPGSLTKGGGKEIGTAGFSKREIKASTTLKRREEARRDLNFCGTKRTRLHFT